MKTLTVKVPDELNAKLESVAAQRGENKSTLVRAAIEDLVETGLAASTGSCLDLASDLAGSAEGPSDLSHNKKHLSGYGR